MKRGMAKVERVVLGEVAEIECVSVRPEKINGCVCLSLEDLNADDGSIAVNLLRVAPKSAKFAFGPEHVLYGKLRPYLRKVARPSISGVCSTDILPIRPGNRLDRSYLFHFLRTPGFTESATNLAVGVNLPRISPKALSTFAIPLPPLEEQRRIAAILDKADALRAKRRAALAKLDTLTQSIFLDMFGDPATNPKGWPVVSIADICEVKGGKRLPKGEEYSSVPTPFRYIRVLDLKGGRVDESALVYLKPEIQAQIARYVVNTGDVIISIAGSIGLVAPVPESLDGVNLTENAAKLVRRSSGRYEAEFLARFLETDNAQGQIGSHIGQVTIGKLALFRIEKLKVPLPPIDLQRQFLRRAAEVGLNAAAQREAQSRVDELFASLQHRAFRGEL